MITISTVSWFALFCFTLYLVVCGVIRVNWMGLCRNERCTKCLAVKDIFDERWHFFAFLFQLVHGKKRTGKSNIGNCVSSLYYKRADTVAPIYRWTNNNFNGIRYSLFVIVGLFDSDSYSLIRCHSGASSLFQLVYFWTTKIHSLLICSAWKLLNINSTAWSIIFFCCTVSLSVVGAIHRKWDKVVLITYESSY